MHQKLSEFVTDLIEHDIDLQFAKRQLEKAYIQEILLRNHSNIGKSAKKLGIHRNTLAKRIRDLEIQVHPS